MTAKDYNNVSKIMFSLYIMNKLRQDLAQNVLTSFDYSVF